MRFIQKVFVLITLASTVLMALSIMPSSSIHYLAAPLIAATLVIALLLRKINEEVRLYY